jgi:DNA-binding response OmpR family regulator
LLAQSVDAIWTAVGQRLLRLRLLNATTSGYQVDLGSSGNEALSRGPAHDYAVITIDRMLPDIDGLGSWCLQLCSPAPTS